MRNGGNGRVQFASPCAKHGEATAQHPNNKSELNLGSTSNLMPSIPGSPQFFVFPYVVFQPAQ
jgi:hypothetical protein